MPRYTDRAKKSERARRTACAPRPFATLGCCPIEVSLSLGITSSPLRGSCVVTSAFTFVLYIATAGSLSCPSTGKKACPFNHSQSDHLHLVNNYSHCLEEVLSTLRCLLSVCSLQLLVKTVSPLLILTPIILQLVGHCSFFH